MPSIGKTIDHPLDTWTPKSAGPAPFPHSGLPDLLVTREGAILHVTEPGIHWKADAGQTWHHLGLPRMAYYPKSLQLADGHILVLCSRQRGFGEAAYAIRRPTGYHS